MTRQDIATMLLARMVEGAMSTNINQFQDNDFIRGLANMPKLAVELTDELDRQLRLNDGEHRRLPGKKGAIMSDWKYEYDSGSEDDADHRYTISNDVYSFDVGYEALAKQLVAILNSHDELKKASRGIEDVMQEWIDCVPDHEWKHSHQVACNAFYEAIANAAIATAQ